MSDRQNESSPHADGVAAAKRPYNPQGGEDEGSVESGGDNSDVHDDQKPINGTTSFSADDVEEDDPHKTEHLTQAGRDIDPDEGGE